jgi:uncharacterized protein (TIGR00156 family)
MVDRPSYSGDIAVNWRSVWGMSDKRKRMLHMLKRRTILASLFAVTCSASAFAQFIGPSVQGAPSSVADALNLRVGTYVTLEGNITAHLRGDYFQFSDGSGQIRVEIPAATFGGRQVSPQTRVRIMGEVDQSNAGRYIWVKSLNLL